VLPQEDVSSINRPPNALRVSARFAATVADSSPPSSIQHLCPAVKIARCPFAVGMPRPGYAPTRLHGTFLIRSLRSAGYVRRT
jgi:hypothetical protein